MTMSGKFITIEGIDGAGTTTQVRKVLQTNDPDINEKFKPPLIPKSIRNIIQLE